MRRSTGPWSRPRRHAWNRRRSRRRSRGWSRCWRRSCGWSWSWRWSCRRCRSRCSRWSCRRCSRWSCRRCSRWSCCRCSRWSCRRCRCRGWCWCWAGASEQFDRTHRGARRVETVGDQHSAIGQGALRVPGPVADHRRAGAERTATDGEDVGGGGGHAGVQRPVGDQQLARAQR